jgi:hypothetical protein
MSTGYFAQITDGVVTDVRRTTKEYIDANQSFYPGVWVEVQDMDQYPAIGWTWAQESGFLSPPFIEEPIEVLIPEGGLEPPIE